MLVLRCSLAPDTPPAKLAGQKVYQHDAPFTKTNGALQALMNLMGE
jgi:hypothetical protein